MKPTPATSTTGKEAHAERRQLTVMYIDLVDSTTQVLRLDPEDWKTEKGKYFACIAEVLTKCRALIGRREGDGALVVFGFPVAHENNAEHAIRSALEVVAAVSRLHDSFQPKVRIGIATGTVVVHEIVGTEGTREYDVDGIPPNMAARLRDIAGPNAIVIESTTWRLTGGLFEHRDLGRVKLNKFPEPVQAWEVLGTNTSLGRFEAQHQAGLSALVGRDEELDLLSSRWREARAGRGQVVLLSGEPGIGKSRLAVTLLSRLFGEPHIPLRYFCSQHAEGSPLHPFIQQLERAARFVPRDDASRKLDKLEAALGSGHRHPHDLPLLADLLSIPAEGRYPKLQLTPKKRREQTMEALIRQLEFLSKKRPLLLVFEDAHWIDPTSRVLLEAAIDRVAAMPVLGIVIYRSNDKFKPTAWERKEHVTALTLRALSEPESIEVIESIAGKGALLKPVLADIVKRTDGVPLFLEELTKAVLEASAHEEIGKEPKDRAPQPFPVVPGTLRASLEARISRLDSAREILQIGAAIGREFSYDLLAAVAGKGEAELRAALDRIIVSGMVYRTGTESHETYLFKHALIQDAAYDTMLRGARQKLHQRIARVLESEFKEAKETQPELLAHHCTEAAMNEEAVTYWLDAGRRALVRSTMLEGITRLRKGLEVVSRLPEGVSRQRNELGFQILIGQALTATQGYAAPVTGATYARARELCESLDQPLELVSALHGQWTHVLLRAELHSAQHSAEKLLQRGEARNDAISTLVGYRCSGVTRFPLGEFGAARDYLERGLDLFDPEQRSVYSAVTIDDPKVVMLTYLSWALLYLGDLDQARLQRELALAEARRLAHLYSLTHALNGWAFSEIMVRSPHTALRYLDELLPLTEEHGISYYRAVGTIFRGWCLAAIGQERLGLEVITQGVAAYRATGSILYLPTFLTLLADVYGKAGQPKQGLTELAEAARIAEETHTRNDLSEIHRVQGELLAALNEPAAAETSLGQALAVARRQGARLLELHAAGSLAELWYGQHRRIEARDLVSNIYGRITEGVDTPAMKRAKALIDAWA